MVSYEPFLFLPVMIGFVGGFVKVQSHVILEKSGIQDRKRRVNIEKIKHDFKS
jgi:hypothetical protein